MNVRITDRKVFESLHATDVVAYLRSEGWELAGRYSDMATLWNRENSQILIPQDASFGDFSRRMAEALNTLAEVEHRSQLQILRDLTTATSDVIRLRVFSSSITDGSVVLEGGVTLFESAKDIVLSGARAAFFPRAYYRSRLPGPADEYMRKVRLGQTEQGSYIVNIICPVSPELPPLDPAVAASIEEPYDRRVTRTLAGALHKSATAARDAAVKPDMALFTSAVRDGVSANLCAALADIGEVIEDGQIEVDFSWARSRTKPNVPSSHIFVPHDSVPIMREAARVLRETFLDNNFELIGPVVRLQSTNAATGGEVLVYAEVDTWRKVRLCLEGPLYEEAVRAHKEGLEVHCRGSLKKEGRYFTLRDVREFVVEEEEP